MKEKIKASDNSRSSAETKTTDIKRMSSIPKKLSPIFKKKKKNKIKM